MSTKAFTGGAGTGKTTSLLRELEMCLAAHPLLPGQRVLALTFMHGSRHRLAERLSKSSARRHFDCMTLDRLAWEICRRWRSRLRMTGLVAPIDLDAPDYEATCEATGRLLSSADVANWVAARYPMVVVDEFQDLSPPRVTIVQRLHERVTLLVAADDFQNLFRADESPGVAWVRDLGIATELQINQRTSDADLISAAHALRNGTTLPDFQSTSFKLISAPHPRIAASFISQTIAPAAGKNVVILSACHPESSPWVKTVFELVGTEQYGNQKAGPVAIKWETTSDAMADGVISTLGIADSDEIVKAAAIFALERGPIATPLRRWTEHQHRILGRASFAATEVRAQVKRAAQHVRSFGSVSHSGRRAMTIHQAKNREFPVVIVLWPFAVVGAPVLARRLLYNAVTRAQKRAIVIVQDPKRKRLQHPPFSS